MIARVSVRGSELAPTKETWKTESSAGIPVVRVDGIVIVKFWYGGFPGVDEWNWGLKGPLTRMVPNASPAGRQELPGHDNIPITTAISTEPVKLSPWSTSTTRVEPG